MLAFEPHRYQPHTDWATQLHASQLGILAFVRGFGRHELPPDSTGSWDRKRQTRVMLELRL